MSAQLRLDTLFALQRKRGAGEAELDAPLGAMQRFAPPSKRCTGRVQFAGCMSQCLGTVPLSDGGDICSDCTKRLEKKAADEKVRKAANPEQIAASNVKYKLENAEKVKADKDEWNNSDAGREAKALYRAEHLEELRKSNIEYKRSASGAASRARERASGKKKLANARYREKHIEELRRKGREAAATPMGLLFRALQKMVKGVHWDPVSFPKLGSFQSNEEARAHFESKFEPWMTWENRGAHAKENGYDQVWNIGHWLPRAIFDPTNEDDLRRCWHPDNLFPQCAKKNTEYRDVLIYTDEELLERRHLWPVGANDDLDQLKNLFRYTAV